MIDLHSHLLPALDDGARDLSEALEMARMFEDQGVHHVACTPHILPGVYPNTGPDIRSRVDALQGEIFDAGLALRLVTGADNHVVPDFIARLGDGHLLTLADSRYVLVEPPHRIVPPHLPDLFYRIMAAGYVPVLTHPERLAWIEDNYAKIVEMARNGVWMQITSGALAGRFGARPAYWAERMLGEGLVHILASDAHNTKRRPPDLAEGFRRAERLVGTEQASHLVTTRPGGILANRPAGELPSLPGVHAIPDGPDVGDDARESAGRLADALGRIRKRFIE